MLLPVLLLALAGCAQNPAYFPWFLPPGAVVQTHARPAGNGYFADFDPNAIRLEVRPLESTSPVRAQQVVIATVYDDQDRPRRKRRVEWLVEGVGNIIEVDESGVLAGRGGKIDNKYAFSYTDFFEHTFRRGQPGGPGDFTIRPGQTWCIISSAVEGDTFVTAYAPEIHDAGKAKVTVTHHWVDAVWQTPPPTAARCGTEHLLTTAMTRLSDGRPLAGYRVRYRVLDGPPAALIFRRTTSASSGLASLGPIPGTAEAGVPELVSTSDLNGHAVAGLVQTTPQAGVNRIEIEIIRPPDPSVPSGSGVLIGKGVAEVRWQSAAVGVSLSAPETAPPDRPLTYTVTVRNDGGVDSSAVTLKQTVPDGLELQSLPPGAVREGNAVVWQVPKLKAGGQETFQLVGRPTRSGSLATAVEAETAEQGKASDKAETLIAAPRLKVAQSAPAQAATGELVIFQLTVSNSGNGPAYNVELIDGFEPGLEHESKQNPLQLPIGRLEAGEAKTVPLPLRVARPGRFINRVTAVADGGLKESADHTIEARQASLALRTEGPATLMANKDGVWTARVTNTGAVPLGDVVVRGKLPVEVSFAAADNGGAFEAGEVVWRLGPMGPGEEKALGLTLTGIRPGRTAVRLRATATPDVLQEADAAVEVLGLPLLHVEVSGGPAALEAGGRGTWVVAVTNPGSLPADRVTVAVVLPEVLKPVGGGGRTAGKVAGQRVEFDSADGLTPGQTWQFTVDAEGARPGDGRLRAEASSRAVKSPLASEKSVRVLPKPAAAEKATATSGPATSTAKER
jgi:uncharacterized repeat protein (TIGR01451 family)